MKKHQEKSVEKKKTSSNLEAHKKLKILVTIVARNKADFYLNIYEGYEINLQTVMYGKGTAPNNISSLLGFVDNNKAVIFSVIKEEKVKEVLNACEDKYFKTKGGKGVAFTIPISSIIGVSIYKFLCYGQQEAN
jgi:nitrogen regulatory protein PII